jgi:hypothetical protein
MNTRAKVLFINVSFMHSLMIRIDAEFDTSLTDITV